MNNFLKLLAAVLLFAGWAGAIAAKHAWPDIDVGAFILAIQGGLTTLGIVHFKGNTQ